MQNEMFALQKSSSIHVIITSNTENILNHETRLTVGPQLVLKEGGGIETVHGPQQSVHIGAVDGTKLDYLQQVFLSDASPLLSCKVRHLGNIISWEGGSCRQSILVIKVDEEDLFGRVCDKVRHGLRVLVGPHVRRQAGENDSVLQAVHLVEVGKQKGREIEKMF